MTTSETRARVIVYARAGGMCEVCARPADSVHHRMKQGRPWDPANLLSLCGDGVRFCHGWIEANPTHAMLLGLWLPRGTDYTTAPAYVKPSQFWRAWWQPDNDGCWTWVDDAPPADHPDTPARHAAALALALARGLPLPTPA